MRVGIAQINILLKNKAANLKKCEQFIKQAQQEQVDVLVFPECTINGYVYNSFDEAYAEADPVPGDLTDSMVSLCKEHQITAVFGLLEKENGLLYNTAVLITPEGMAGKYRKTHLLYLGVDRYTSPGDDVPIFNLPQARAAMLICYDLRSPEPARTAALKEAQIILSPTNLPEGANAYADFINKTRACENRVFVVSANRVGVEQGVQFIGKSQIVSIGGQILVEASRDKEELIYADIIPNQADIKHIVCIPGEYEFDVFGDRQPALYKVLVKKNIRS